MDKILNYTVCTRCFTYNHVAFIEDAMNGFTMQVTKFPTVTLIVDDASCDGEQEVIKKYLADNFMKPYRTEDTDDYYLICAKHNTNPNCLFVVFLLKYNHYSIRKPKVNYLAEWQDEAKYVAICEGDDYWTDENKLQMQVDYMESHEGCSMCFHDVNTYSMYEEKYINKFSLPREDRNYKSRHLFTIGWLAPTASILCRREWMMRSVDYPDWARIEGLGGDITWQMFLSTKGYFHYNARKMSVYRFGVPGSATERSKVKKHKGHQAYLDFLEKSNRFLFGGKYTLYVWYKKVRFFVHRVIYR